MKFELTFLGSSIWQCEPKWEDDWEEDDWNE